jgi:polyhydroxyalkanoate synthesis regulator phasin
MGRKKIIASIAIALTLGIGATAYAASNGGTFAPKQRMGLGKITTMRGYQYVSNVLKSLGLSDTDITNARNSGKTLYDLAAEKGITQEEFKAALLNEKTKAIDAAVENGTITKEEGETLKANLRTNMDNCTGNFGQGRGFNQGQGRGRGQGQGMMGFGQGRGNGCQYFTNNNSVK